MTLKSSAWSIAAHGKCGLRAKALFPALSCHLPTPLNRIRSDTSWSTSLIHQRQFTSILLLPLIHDQQGALNKHTTFIHVSQLQRAPLEVQGMMGLNCGRKRHLSSSSSSRSSQPQQEPTSPPPPPPPPQQLSKAVLLKNAVKDYGSTVIVFHVAISLVSLGSFYTAVSSGIDVVALLTQLPLVGDKIAGSNFGAGASTFVMAYAVHKIFAPVRISITLTATPFIVKYLRKKGILKV